MRHSAIHAGVQTNVRQDISVQVLDVIKPYRRAASSLVYLASYSRSYPTGYLR